MRYSLADLSERMFNRPVAISMHKAQVILGVLGPRLNVSSLLIAGDENAKPIATMQAMAAKERAQVEMMPGDADLQQRDWETGALLDPYEVWNGVAILKVRGTLMAEGGLNPSSGMTSYNGLSFKARTAMADSRVLGVLLDDDSGGGEVVDLFETCAALKALAAAKPMRTVVRGAAASAAYALACCGQEITCAPYSWVGSIGALIAHADFSKQLENEGVAVTLISSAAHKTDGHPALPLAADVRAKLQAEVDASAATFIAHVAEQRGKSTDEIASQEAAFFAGDEAFSLGLVDKIMSWDDSLKEFAEAVNRRRPPAASPVRAPSASANRGVAGMDPSNLAPAAENQPDVTAEAPQAAIAAAITAERARIGELLELDGESRVSAELKSAITSGTSAGAFAIAQMKSTAQQQRTALESARADAAKPDQLPEARADATGSQQKVNRGLAFVNRNKAG
jgi:capsid assembly protease